MPCCSAMRRIQRSGRILIYFLSPRRWCQTCPVGPSAVRASTPASAPRDFQVAPGDRAVRSRHHGRPPGIGFLPDLGVQRQPRPAGARRSPPRGARRRPRRRSRFRCLQQGQMKVLMFSMTPSTGTPTFSNIFRPLRASASAMSWGVVTMTAPGQGHLLGQGQLDVAGARRQVHDQVVQVVPVGLEGQLLQRLRHHRARARSPAALPRPGSRWNWSPGRGPPAARRSCRPGIRGLRPMQPQHPRLARAVDVRIEDADARALPQQRQGQIHGRGGLADAALAGCDGNHVPDVRQRREIALHGMGRRP